MILGIETSCDDTCAAVVTDDGQVLSNVVASQGLLHERYGGVVPEIASRRHLELVDAVLDDALERGDVGLDDVDRVEQLEVAPGRDLRHDAAVARVQQTLRRDDVRVDRPVAPDDGRAGVVAARLDAEDHAPAPCGAVSIMAPAACRSGTVRHMMRASSLLSW